MYKHSKWQNMKILFLIFHGLSPVSGISKKIKYQMKGLEANGHKVFFCHYEIQADGHKVRMIDDQVLEDYGKSPLAPLRKRIGYHAVLQYARENEIGLVYIRSFHNANPFTIRFYRKLQKAGIKTVMEIPTYPYDQEYRNVPLFWKIELGIDKIFRKRMAKALSAIVTFTDEPVIFGKETICISNGIDFDAIPLKKNAVHPDHQTHLLAVAEVHYWHAYDRILSGLGEYYRQPQNREVFLHIVGGLGQYEQQLFDRLIREYNLQDRVTLYGQLQGEKLDRLFDQSDFAIGSLGRHRSGIDKIKTLKNREYAARGIPFIYSETDEDFDRMSYILKATPDDTPIDIREILHFLDTHSIPAQEIRESIRDLSWKTQMQKVIDHISKEK